jgi:hypothetical protein
VISSVNAELDISLVTEDFREKDTTIGTWLNVVGYIQDRRMKKDGKTINVQIKALLAWDAGSVDVNDYSSVLKDKISYTNQFKAI